MKSPKLTFYGGVQEIGGNKILLEDKNTRIFLDFGTSFSDEAKFFSNYLTPRSVNGAGDYLEFDILPRLSGLYSKGAIKNTGLKYAPASFDAIMISHPHMDHVGYLPFIDENIPVYLGECTKTIIDSMKEPSRVDLGEHEYRTFRTGRTIKIGDLGIQPVHVDHSVPGAYGFIIETSGGSFVYTGDLRLHGPMAHMTEEFAEKASQHDPAAMVSEGTRICSQECQVVHSEKSVKEQSNEVVQNTSNLVIVAFYSRDVDRFKTFYEIAKNNDRKFVISLKLAYLLWKLKDDSRLQIPNIMNEDDIMFYKKRKKSGEFTETDYYVWERPFLEKAVNHEYIRKNQSKLLFNLDLTGFTELIDIRPSPGSHFIHSMSEPFSEEDINGDMMNRWLDHFGLKYHQIHASGHCQPNDLTRIINKIQPRRLMPVHTEHPELFKKLFKNLTVELVGKGKSYDL
jgi:ribonuclease J